MEIQNVTALSAPQKCLDILYELVDSKKKIASKNLFEHGHGTKESNLLFKFN